MKDNFKKIIFLISSLVVAVAIFGLNYRLVRPWFSGNGPANIGSIEVSYISMARFLVDFYPHLSFAPYWYFGFPFHLFYTPILPVLTALFYQFGHFSLWNSYRLVTGLGLVLVPVSIFFLVLGLTKKLIPGILAALSYTFLPTIFCFILPSDEVAKDVISNNFFDPRRLVILARWGEGPHTLSLIFLPLVGLFYWRLLAKRKKSDLFFTALFFGLTALTNAVGIYAAVLLLLAIFFSAWVKKPASFGEIFRLSLITALIAYGLIAFWYNFSFIKTFFGEGGGVVGNYLSLFPWGLVLILLVGGVYFFFCRKILKNQALVASLTWFLLVFVIVYVYYTSAPPDFSDRRIALAPQALRLMTEVDMALSILLAVIISQAMAFLARRGLVGKIASQILGWALVGILLAYGFSYLPYGQKAVSGEVTLEKTGESEIANWLAGHVDQAKGERVFVAGNYSFYLNYFTNIWQLRGGLYQAMTHYWPGHIYYQICNGWDKEITYAWLKAANIRYLVVNTSESRELYKEFKYPLKFSDLELVYQSQGDFIYQLPNSQPVRVVNLEPIKGLVAPKKADDKPALLTYSAWLDQGSTSAFTIINNDLYKIKAKLGQNQGILVQITADSGFRANSKEGNWQIVRDPLGFMILVPPTTSPSGEFEISLRHGRTWDVWLGYLISLCSVGVLAFLILTRRLIKEKKPGE